MNELPKGWVETAIFEIAKLHRGVTYKKNDSSQLPFTGSIPILRANNIDDGINFSDLVYVPSSNVSENQIMQDYDILIAMSSGSKNLVGKSAQLPYSAKEYSFGAFCSVLRSSASVKSSYVAFFLQSRLFRDLISQKSKGIGINNLKKDDVLNSMIPLPPLAEQKRIVEKIEALFSRLDAGIAALEKTKAQLKRYKQSVLKAAFEGKYTSTQVQKENIAVYFPAGLEEFNVPSSWCQLTVSDVTESMKNGIYKPSSFYRDLEGTPCLRMYNIDKGLINFRNLKYMELTSDEIDDYALSPGDLLVNRVNSKELVGKTALITFDHPCVFESKNIRLRVKDELIIPAYLNFWLLLFGQYFFNFNSQQVVGMASISQGQIGSLPLSLPKKEEQLLIINEIEKQQSTANKALETVEHELKKAQALKSKILEYAFTGKLVPQNPDDEPAEVLLERIKAEKEASQSTKKTRKRK